MSRPAAIDCWVNPPGGFARYKPDYLVEVARSYFKREREIFEDAPLEQLLADMDAAGVARAVLTIDGNDPAPYRDIVTAFPDRFLASAVVDPAKGMATVRQVERLVRDFDVRLIRVVPFLVGRPPNDRIYYPLYTKCVELGVPVSINTGIPGPPMPAEPQRPLHLDDVCLFFPELTCIMCHGADPWWGEAIRLLLKYPNLYMMTSAYAPKYLPAELLQFMNTRGQGKVLFASDHPVLSFGRCLDEAEALPLREGVLARYLHDNAAALFGLSS